MKQTNTAKSTSYILTLIDRPELSFKAMNASIGSVLLGETPYATSYTNLVIPGNTLEFNPLNLKILCSEELDEWINVYRWVIECTKARLDSDVFDRLELTVLNLQNIPILKFTYKDVWPTMLGDVLYDLDSEEQTLTFDLALRYSSMDVELLKTGELIQYANTSKI